MIQENKSLRQIRASVYYAVKSTSRRFVGKKPLLDSDQSHQVPDDIRSGIIDLVKGDRVCCHDTLQKISNNLPEIICQETNGTLFTLKVQDGFKAKMENILGC